MVANKPHKADEMYGALLELDHEIQERRRYQAALKHEIAIAEREFARENQRKLLEAEDNLITSQQELKRLISLNEDAKPTLLDSLRNKIDDLLDRKNYVKSDAAAETQKAKPSITPFHLYKAFTTIFPSDVSDKYRDELDALFILFTPGYISPDPTDILLKFSDDLGRDSDIQTDLKIQLIELLNEILALVREGVIEFRREITNPEASRDTATKDIPSKTDSNKKYPTPPDANVKEPFTSAVDAKSVGKMLKDARTTVGVTQAAIGEALQKSEGAIRSLENSKMTPSLPKIQEYADVIGYDVEVRLIPRDVS